MKCFHFPELPSTQDKVFELFESGEKAPFQVTSDLQTKGRGRLDRPWIFEKGNSLALSLGVRLKTSELSALSLVCGLAVKKALQIESLEIKWPNDLMLKNKKVGGLLIESKSLLTEADVAIGLGLNLYDLKEPSFKGIQKEVKAELISESLLSTIEVFGRKGFSFFQREFEMSMWKIHERISIQWGEEKVWVQIKGVDARGFLVTEENGIIKLSENGELLLEN